MNSRLLELAQIALSRSGGLVAYVPQNLLDDVGRATICSSPDREIIYEFLNDADEAARYILGVSLKSNDARAVVEGSLKLKRESPALDLLIIGSDDFSQIVDLLPPDILVAGEDTEEYTAKAACIIALREDPKTLHLMEKYGNKVLTYGLHEEAILQTVEPELSTEGLRFKLQIKGSNLPVQIPLAKREKDLEVSMIALTLSQYIEVPILESISGIRRYGTVVDLETEVS